MGWRQVNLGMGWPHVPWRRGNRQIMKLAQSSHVPASGKRPRPKDLPWLVPFTLRGLFELVRARLIFTRFTAKSIPQRNAYAKGSAVPVASLGEADLARIAYVIPRLSDRLPWRSDCLIQSIAGQNWLSSLGAYGEIQIGVENPKDGKFGAHAWLLHRDTVVTGGDIAQYDLILSDSPAEQTTDSAAK